MTKKTERIQVHRFGDKVAIAALPGGPTIYLSAELARKLSETLTRAHCDIRMREFTDSTFGTVLLGERE